MLLLYRIPTVNGHLGYFLNSPQTRQGPPGHNKTRNTLDKFSFIRPFPEFRQRQRFHVNFGGRSVWLLGATRLWLLCIVYYERKPPTDNLPLGTFFRVRFVLPRQQHWTRLKLCRIYMYHVCTLCTCTAYVIVSECCWLRVTGATPAQRPCNVW